MFLLQQNNENIMKCALYCVAQMPHACFSLCYTLETTTVEPQLSGPHLSVFSVNQTTEMTVLLE